jgi:hypothetical protein
LKPSLVITSLDLVACTVAFNISDVSGFAAEGILLFELLSLVAEVTDDGMAQATMCKQCKRLYSLSHWLGHASPAGVYSTVICANYALLRNPYINAMLVQM